MRRAMLAALGFIFMAGSVVAAEPPYGRSIWLDPNGGEGGPADYMALFEAKAPWGRVAQAVQGFGIGEQKASYGSESDLRKIFPALERLGIGLGVGMLPLSGGPDGCGKVEGNSARGQSLANAERLRSLGGHPAFYGMDEPLFYGALYVGEGENRGCRAPIPDVVEDVARSVHEVRSVFPDVAVGDVEPLAGFSGPEGPAIIEQWLVGFERATGSPLAFFRLDIDWDASWQDPIAAIAPVLSSHGVPLQIIFNGRGSDTSDAAWVASAKANVMAYDAAGLPPAAAVFQTWQPYPSRVLPETDANSLTGLALWYLDRAPNRK